MIRLLLIVALFAPTYVIVGFSAQDSVEPVRIIQEEWQHVDRFVPDAPIPETIWAGEPLVHPRGVMLDSEHDVLYVTDPADPVGGQPARIVSFKITDGALEPPQIFFMDPEIMISAKWGFVATLDGQTQILVADQGQSEDEYFFSGEGAKVFTIPVLDDGSAGEPRMLWEGAPFVCPTGIAVVGPMAYITDPCAGPILTRPERPDHPFPSSVIFGLRLDGSEPPVVLKSGAPFTSLIGICILTPGEIIVNDTDSGRIDPSETGGRPGFAPPANADRWVLKILNEETGELSDPVRTPFFEEGPITLEFSPEVVEQAIGQQTPIRIETTGDTRIIPYRPTTLEEYADDPLMLDAPTSTIEVDASLLSEDWQITLNVASNVIDETVSLDVVLPDGETVTVENDKSAALLFGLLDNKHGGAKGGGDDEADPDGGDEGDDGGGDGGEDDDCGYFCGGDFGGGGAGRSFLRYSTDNAPGHGSIIVYRDDGGSFAILALGAPLDRPVSAQLNEEETLLWIVDQGNGTLFSLPFPTDEEFDQLFP